VTTKPESTAMGRADRTWQLQACHCEYLLEQCVREPAQSWKASNLVSAILPAEQGTAEFCCLYAARSMSSSSTSNALRQYVCCKIGAQQAILQGADDGAVRRH